MKSLYEIMSKGYEMPHKFSFITLEEFCEINNLDENSLTEEQINFFMITMVNPVDYQQVDMI